MAWAFFVHVLGKWVSSQEGQEMEKGKNQQKTLIMKSSIVEIVPTSDDNVFKLPRASQRPYGAKNVSDVVFSFN